jgi:prepilin-type N-terminal cleavage/methylation domain-containing protein
MMKFNREEGLTLIELLITIAVIAIVAAISVPVITNVVGSANANALTQTNSDVADFVNKYNNTGMVAWDGTGELVGFVDLNGDNRADANEAIETLTVDTDKFGQTNNIPAVVISTTGTQTLYSATNDLTAPQFGLN